MTPEVQSAADAERERAIFAKLRTIDDNERASHAQKGILCRAVRDQMLWQYRHDPETDSPCKSWSRWLHMAAPYGYSTCHKALQDIEELSDVPEEHLTKIQSGNFPTLLQLSTAVRADPKVLEAAKTQRPDQFVETIRRHHPDQHVEHRLGMKFTLDSSAIRVVNQALEAAQERGARDRDEALEMICVNALQDWRIEDEVTNSIRGEAHETA